MPYLEQESINEFENYTDEALREIIYLSTGYETHVLEKAKSELLKRHEDLFALSNTESITLISIINCLNFDDLTDMIYEYIKKKSEIHLYKKVFEKLLIIECRCDNPVDLIVTRPDKKSDKLYVYGQTSDNKEKIDVTFLTWNQWLNINVEKEQILRYGKEQIFVASLIKMTANGFDENDTKSRLAEMENNFGTEAAIENEEAQTELQEDETEIWEADAEISGSFLTQGLLAHRESKKNERLQNAGKQQIRPWVRYFARMIDNSCFGGIVYFSLMAISPNTFKLYESIKYISLAPIVWILVEAILLSTVGTTLGKWILKVLVRNNDGTKLNFDRSLLRSIFVWACGLGFDVTYLSMILMIISYFHINKNKKTIWDEKLQINVSHEVIGVWRVILAFVSFLLFPVMLIVLSHKILYF